MSNKLSTLPETVNECLGGLQADQQLYQRILHRQPARRRRPLVLRAVAAAAMLVFLLGLGAAGLNNLLNREREIPRIITLQAGGPSEAGSLRALDVPRGSITLSAEGSVPRYVGVWAKASGGNFPLIRVQGRYYRLLTNPTQIDGSMLGASLGSVAIHSKEPALDQSQEILSNVVPQGSEVSFVRGMDGSAVAAQVDGKLRVFQRVSFSGSALVGGEGLGATLNGQVVGLQLSGVGSVTDPAKVSQLMRSLLSSTFQGAATRSTDQALLIQYDNGIVLQMAVKGDNVIACGTWHAADFLQAFKAEAGQ